MAVHRTKQKTQKAKPLRYAERITRLREHLGLTPAAFAARLGAVGDAQWVKDLEAGKYRMGKRGATPDAFAKLWDESGLDAAGQMTAKPAAEPGSKKVAALRETVRAELRARGLGTVDDVPPPPKPKETQETKATPAPTAVHRTTQRQKDDGPPTGEQYTAYLDLFRYFNRALFEDRLPGVLLSFSRHATRGGFYAHDRWHKGERTTGEIALNPKALSRMTPERLMSVLVHEMCHLWQYAEGTPGRRGYHNVEWADQMETLGLIASATGQPDGKRTGSRMDHYIVADGPFARAFATLPPAYLLPWLSLDQFGKGPAKKDPSKTPYTCPACGVKVWGKPDLELQHIDCDERMKPDA